MTSKDKQTLNAGDVGTIDTATTEQPEAARETPLQAIGRLHAGVIAQKRHARVKAETIVKNITTAGGEVPERLKNAIDQMREETRIAGEAE